MSAHDVIVTDAHLLATSHEKKSCAHHQSRSEISTHVTTTIIINNKESRTYVSPDHLPSLQESYLVGLWKSH